MRLVGRNFQPWKEFSLDIGGLTVIVGQSNQGKSSIFRALKGILRNELSEEFIRNNQDSPLEIEFEVEGHTIKASRKKKGSTKYVVDGKEYTSLNGKVPEELDKLGFGEAKVGDYSIDPIFANQNKAQFLIDSDRWKPQELNSILGAFSSTEKLDAGKKQANLRITQNKAEASLLASEIRTSEEKAAKLEEVVGDVALVAENLLRLENDARKVASLNIQIGKAVSLQAKIKPRRDIAQSIPFPDALKAQETAELGAYLRMAVASSRSMESLKVIESHIEETTEAWNRVIVTFKTGKALGEVASLREKKKGHSEAHLHQLEEVLSISNSSLEASDTSLRITKLVKEVSCSLESLSSLREGLEGLEEEISLQENILENLYEEVAKEASQKRAIEAKGVVCPTCNRPLEVLCQ